MRPKRERKKRKEESDAAKYKQNNNKQPLYQPKMHPPTSPHMLAHQTPGYPLAPLAR